MTTSSNSTPVDQTPRYSASEQPVTRGYRVAFQFWVLSVLLTLVISLTLYLFDKLYFAFVQR